METIFDLPTHTLVIHFAVVAVPVVAIGAVALALRPGWRRSLGWWLLGGAAVALVGTLVARQTGEAFDEFTQGSLPIDDHRSLANATTALVGMLFLAVLVFVLFGRRVDAATAAGDAGAARLSLVLNLVAVVTVVLAVLSTIWMIRTGHEGAKATWEPTVEIFGSTP